MFQKTAMLIILTKKQQFQSVNVSYPLFVSKSENILKQAACFFHTLKET